MSNFSAFYPGRSEIVSRSNQIVCFGALTPVATGAAAPVPVDRTTHQALLPVT